jgi:hypothetical protein
MCNADQLTGDAQSGGASSTRGYGYDPAGNRLSGSVSSSATGQTVAGHTTAAVTNVMVNAVPATLSNGTNFTVNVPLAAGTNKVNRTI